MLTKNSILAAALGVVLVAGPAVAATDRDTNRFERSRTPAVESPAEDPYPTTIHFNSNSGIVVSEFANSSSGGTSASSGESVTTSDESATAESNIETELHSQSHSIAPTTAFNSANSPVPSKGNIERIVNR